MPVTFWGGVVVVGRGGMVFLGVAEKVTSRDNVGEQVLFCFVWLFIW